MSCVIDTKATGELHDGQTVPRTQAATVLRIGLREMGANGPSKSRLTVPKTIMMMLARPPMINF